MVKVWPLWCSVGSILLFVGAQAHAATCFCSFIAAPGTNPAAIQSPQSGQGIEVLKVTAGGYTQGIHKGRCQSYCKGQWSALDKTELAKRHPKACGSVGLVVFAKIGTAAYERANSASIDVGGVEQWTCPSGMWLHTDNRTCVTGAGCHVAGIPDQELKGGYFFWKGDLYKLMGPATWDCKH